jgi:predicted TIM-barrel fold metal-dependent hydrolase
MPAFAMTDEIDSELVKQYPNKFIAQCGATNYKMKVKQGKEKRSITKLCEELDKLLSTGLYRAGIGEGIPLGQGSKEYAWKERFEEICQIMEVARKHKVAVGYHTGMVPSGYLGDTFFFALSQNEFGDPLLCHDIAAKYPDVPIILQHGGMQSGPYEHYMDRCFEVAAAHPNVYLETGMYWAELYEKPLRDPNIGVEKLLWGTDWGASIPVQWRPGGHPGTYFDQNKRDGLPLHQIDYYGWSLRQLDKLDIPQDDLNLILGGNAVRLFRLDDKVPHKRLFREYLKA